MLNYIYGQTKTGIKKKENRKQKKTIVTSLKTNTVSFNITSILTTLIGKQLLFNYTISFFFTIVCYVALNLYNTKNSMLPSFV